MTGTLVVGLGPMGLRHIAALEATPGLEAVAAVDTAAVARRAFTTEHPDIPCFADLREALQETAPDLVGIATNGPSHAALSSLAMDLGAKGLLVEKPFATSLAAASGLIEQAQVAGVRLAVNHSRRWSRGYQELAELISGEDLGGPAVGWVAIGGTGLGNLGTHYLDLFSQLFAAAAVAVSGHLDAGVLPNPRGERFHDPGGSAVVHFHNGARLHLEQPEAAGTFLPLHVLTRYGRVIIDEGTRTIDIAARSPEDRQEPLTRYGTPLQPLPAPDLDLDIVALAGRAYSELAAGGPVSCTGTHGYRSLEMLIALHASAAQESRIVRLPVTDPALIELELSIT